MSAKEHWKARAKRFEQNYHDVAEQRSQALADLDREATEVELLRTVLGSLMKEGAFDISYRDLCWETAATSAHLTPEQIQAVDRAKAHVLAHTEHLDADEVAERLGAVPLEQLEPEAQERGHVRLAQAAVVGNHRNQATEARRQEAIDEVDVAVTLTDAATVIRTVRDDLLNPDRPLSLGALALMLGSVLPRVEYQAGCEATIYSALHQVTLRHAIADTFRSSAGAGETWSETADRVLVQLRSHIPKLTAYLQEDH